MGIVEGGHRGKSRLSKTKQDRLIEHFITGATARTASALVGVNKSTGSYYFHRLREIIFKVVEDVQVFADQKNHINEIKNFRNQAERHLRKFNGIPKDHFHLYFKECEWRFNNPKIKNQLNTLK